MNKRSSTLAKVLKYIGKYKFLMLISAVLALGIVALTLYVPMIIGNSIDLIVGKDNVEIEKIVSNLITAGIIILITAIMQWVMTYINNKVTYLVVRDMRNRAFGKLQRLPISYIDSSPKGDVVNRIINDVDHFADGLLLGFTQLFTGVLTIVGTLGFMIAISWKIALVVVVLTPLSLFIAKFIGTKTHSMFMLRSKTNAEATAHIDESIGNQKVVIAFSHEDESCEKYEEINARLEKASLNAIFFSSLVNPTTRFVNNTIYAAVALAGAFTAIATHGASIPFTIGQLSCLLSYTNQYTKPFNEISGVVTEFQNALASCARIFELIETEPEISDDTCELLSTVNGHVEFNSVNFSYDKSKKLLEDISLKVDSGKRIAIVGPTGCGKTTLINLLMRFYDTDSGSILVDGKNIKSVTRNSLRSNFGMVLQDSWLFAGTIKDNIALARPDATDEDIILAAKSAHAHSFIKRLPDGYNTVIAEGGGILSQGQKQLICIARLMLNLPPMLILDEATSSIDTRTEIKIQEAFASMMEGRTSFIVAHRLSTIKNADTILVMKNGNIIEQGTHTELMRQCGFYRELHDSQFTRIQNNT